jgi:uncharacterized membrane protein
MSISSIGSSSSADSAAAAQLAIDQQRLLADMKAKADQKQLQADNTAIAKDQLALTQANSAQASSSQASSSGAGSSTAGGFGIDTYL